jgi:hypothetical protein
MRAQKWLFLTVTVVLVLAFAGLTGCTCHINHQYERGPVFDAAMKTVGQEGPVKDDLIARGLYQSFPDGEEVVDIGGIKKLVEEGVYAIDEEGYLVFGQSYTPPP